jgi:hypothetical protein
MAQAGSVSTYVLPLPDPSRLTKSQSQVSNDDSVFNATWEWSKNPSLVHAFPNIRLESDQLPIQLSNLSALNIAVSWTMTATESSDGDLAAIDAGANVVVDMFLDPDPLTANSTTLPKYEVMVWMGAFGGKKPIGFNASIENPPTYSMNGTDLYVPTICTNNYQSTDFVKHSLHRPQRQRPVRLLLVSFNQHHQLQQRYLSTASLSMAKPFGRRDELSRDSTIWHGNLPFNFQRHLLGAGL